MQITDTIIQEFFAGKCSASEAEAVAAHLEEHPETANRLLEASWMEGDELLTSEESTNMLKQIRAEAGITGKRINWVRIAISIAASLIIFFVAGWLLQPNAPVNVVASTEMQNEPWIMKSNITNKEIKFNLEDSSFLRLKPESMIRYHAFAGKHKRDIFLSGESFFKVAKDKSKPFTVYAAGVATTAVGTEFSVCEKNGRVTVKLYEGKVKIHAAKPLKAWKEKEVYLSPGQEFVYDSAEAVFIVRPIEKEKATVPEKISARSDIHPLIMAATIGNWYMFNNQSLTNVFSQLEEMYNVDIVYDQADVKNVYFIGRFEKTDSLSTILKDIALLKKLNIHHTGNRYVITRKKP